MSDRPLPQASKSDLEGATEEELVNIAVETGEELFGGAGGAQAELGRRQLAESRLLRRALGDLKASTDRAATITIILTGALVLFTLATLVLTVVIVLHRH